MLFSYVYTNVYVSVCLFVFSHLPDPTMIDVDYFCYRNVIRVSNVEVIFGHIDSHIPVKRIEDLRVQNVHSASILDPN